MLSDVQKKTKAAVLLNGELYHRLCALFHLCFFSHSFLQSTEADKALCLSGNKTTVNGSSCYVEDRGAL